MKVRLNLEHPSRPLFWFTTDQMVYLNFEKPTINIERPSQLPLRTIKQLINGHKRKLINVDNIAFLEQLYREGVEKKKKEGKKETVAQQPSGPRDIRRTKPIKDLKKINENSDPATEMASLSIAKLKVVVEQTTNIDLLTRVYKIEMERQHPRKSALAALEKRAEELGYALTTLVPAEGVSVEDKEDGYVAVDQETKEAWEVDKDGNPVKENKDSEE